MNDIEVSEALSKVRVIYYIIEDLSARNVFRNDYIIIDYAIIICPRTRQRVRGHDEDL